MTKFDDRLQQNLVHIAEQATPSPTAAWSAIQTRIADQTDQPETEITMLQPDTRIERRLNARLLLAAAAAVILIGGLSVLLFSGRDSNSLDVTDTDTTVPVPSTTSIPSTTEAPTAEDAGDDAAVQVAFDFFDARSQYDGAALVELLSPDAEVFDKQFVGEDGENDFLSLDEIDLAANADFERVTGVQFSNVECSSVELSTATCTFDWENSISRSSGDLQYTAIPMRFTVTDGIITRIEHNFVALPVRPPGAEDVVHVYWTWFDWLLANHPDDVSEMMNSNIVPVRSAETLARWETFTAEFVAESLVPMAVVDAEAAGELLAFLEPGGQGETVRSIFPYSMDLGLVAGSAQDVDDTTWVRLLTADARALDGWVDAQSLIEIEGDVAQPRPLFEQASLVRNALLMSGPAGRLSERTNEVRVSLDGGFGDGDSVWTAFDLNADGTGASEMIEEFAATNALLETDRISIGAPIRTADAQDDIATFFPDATVVELHYSGDAGAEETTWESVVMVFVPDLNTGTTATDVVEDSTVFKIVGLAYFTATG